MLKKRSAPMSAPKPASVMRKSPPLMPILSATMEELPVAMLPKGPAWNSTGALPRAGVGGVAGGGGAGGARVDQHRRVLQRLHQVRLYRLLQHHRHRTGGLQVLRADRLAAPAAPHPAARTP